MDVRKKKKNNNFVYAAINCWRSYQMLVNICCAHAKAVFLAIKNN